MRIHTPGQPVKYIDGALENRVDVASDIPSRA